MTRLPSAAARPWSGHRILWEFHPYLGELVVIGRWAPYLHQRYGPFPSWRRRLTVTAEVDVLVGAHVPADDRPTLSGLLRAAQLSPVRGTPHASVWGNDRPYGETVEFLVPYHRTTRMLGTIVPSTAQPGLGALGGPEIRQRHISVLRVPATSGDDTAVLVDVRVPSLGAYVLKGAATLNRRRPVAGARANPKREKNLLRLRDVTAGSPEGVVAVGLDVRRSS